MTELVFIVWAFGAKITTPIDTYITLAECKSYAEFATKRAETRAKADPTKTASIYTCYPHTFDPRLLADR